jgi:WD40 repeat protein
LAALNCVDHRPNALASHKSAVNCVSWSALNGRSFDLLASCGKDGIIVWQLKYEEGKLKVLKNENLDNKTVVWKVEWNIMGTILASSDQQNSIRLWKKYLA